MTTITEDYVSFEIAKLLKEKGFDEECWCWYEEDGYFRESNDDFGVQSNSDHVVDDDEFNCSAPSQAMTMKWLRVNFGYNILIIADGDLGDLHYAYEIQEINNKLLQVNGSLDIEDQRFDSYEEACEAAIKYCLENLI